jgi:hypothetical protein
MTPYESDDLTEIIEERDRECVTLRSPDSAEDSPDYEEVAVLCDAPEEDSSKR